MMHRTVFLLALAVGSLALSGCSTLLAARKPQAATRQYPPAKFHIERAALNALQPGEGRIEINLAAQEMRLLNAAGQPVVTTQISSGRADTPTPTGEFTVLEKLPTKFSNRYGKWVKADTGEVVVWRIWEHKGPQPPGTVYEGYEMKYWLRLTWPGVGIHNGDFLPGELSSKGCIRTPLKPQQAIWEHADIGTPVVISGSIAGHPDAP